MPSIISLIAAAWQRYRALPALNDDVLWLIAVPSFSIATIERLARPDHLPYWPGYTPPDWAWLPAFILIIGLNVLIVWGSASVLVAARDGAARSSLHVRRLATPFVWPLLVTDVLRTCITILLLIPLVVPGLLYALRTLVAQPVIVAEGLAYRPALRRSVALVKGRTWKVAGTIFGTTLLLFLPLVVLSGILQAAIAAIDPRLLAISDALRASTSAVAAVVSLFVLTAVYDHLRQHPLPAQKQPAS